VKSEVPRYLAPVALSVLSIIGGRAATVRIWQDSIRIPTYLEAGAEPLPFFSALHPSDGGVYPYPIRTRMTENRQDRIWRVLNLENEYLVCRILPEIGARPYSCKDKRNGREMFYANPVLKKVPYGMRGAWVALGIESNFPVAHARANASPTDYGFRNEPDGAGRLVMEDIDRTSGMQWRVEYILRPASTVLEQRVTFYNRGATGRPYLWWANAAFALDDPATRFILPTRLVGEHGDARRDTWPVNAKGQDESLVSTHEEAMAWFATGCREPFFAIYKPTFRSGLAHFADPGVVTGKKVWLWGSKQEKTVHPQVTDNFPFYGEMQAGLFQNQETYEILGPEEHRSFSEYWIPVYDVGGVARVSRDAIVNIERRSSSGPSLLVEVSVTRPIAGAAIRLLNAGKVAFETRADLDPAKRFEKVLNSPAASAYTLQVADAQGSVLLDHTEGRYATLTPDQVPPIKTAASAVAPAETEATILAKARDEEMKEHWAAAWSVYGAGLRKFPGNVALLKGAGILALGLHRFQDTVALLAPVRAIAATDDVSYSYGVALAQLGRDKEASEALAQISPAGSFGQPAALQLALLAARAKNDNAALAALKPLLAGAGGRVRLGAFEVALLRRAGRKDDALKQLEIWQVQDPADTMLRFEKTLLAGDDPEFWAHLAADAERVLALADDYFSMGMYEEALRLLDHSYPELPADQFEPGAVAPAKSPLLAYHRAWCREQLHQPASADLSQAAHLSTQYAFPYLPHSTAVLQYALKANPSDATARYLLGLYLMQGLEAEEAVAEWSKARAGQDRPAGVDEVLAQATQGANKDLAIANTAIREVAAIRERPAAPKNTRRAEAPVSVSPAPGLAAPPAASTPQGIAPSTQLTPQGLMAVASSAMVRSASANAGPAFAAFDPKLFKDEKQPEQVRRAYIEVQLQRLLSDSLSRERCAAALNGIDLLGEEDKSLPFTFHGFGGYMKAAHFQYYLGFVEANCAEQKAARKRWTRVSKMKEALPSVEFVFPVLAEAHLDPENVQGKAAAALETVRGALKGADPSARPSLAYAEGMLLHVTGKDGEATGKLMEAVSSAGGNAVLQYLAQLGLREIQPPK
jgi:hypothetical protein